MKNILLSILLLFVFVSCNNKESTGDIKISENDTLINMFERQDIIDQGKSLFIKYCIECHSLPINEEMPDLRTLLGSLPKDSINSIVNFVCDSKTSSREGGNILRKYKVNGSMTHYTHSFKDSTVIENIRVVVIYSWLASQHGRN